jgi:hypothetical protein
MFRPSGPNLGGDQLWSALLSNKALRTRGQYLAALPMLLNRALTNWQSRAPMAQADANEIVRKSMALADQNMAAAFEFAEKLIHTGHPIEVVQLQQQYLVRQMQALPSQTQELNRVGQKLWVSISISFPLLSTKD